MGRHLDRFAMTELAGELADVGEQPFGLVIEHRGASLGRLGRARRSDAITRGPCAPRASPGSRRRG
jgi:hypothetical protein